ncbi:MAG: hypothetical protein H0V82_09890 [Candidatus Protochlamydia sp.]|nr:hypothetical protein [Candidatus Protochlamydia sp.]
MLPLLNLTSSPLLTLPRELIPQIICNLFYPNEIKHFIALTSTCGSLLTWKSDKLFQPALMLIEVKNICLKNKYISINEIIYEDCEVRESITVNPYSDLAVKVNTYFFRLVKNVTMTNKLLAERTTLFIEDEKIRKRACLEIHKEQSIPEDKKKLEIAKSEAKNSLSNALNTVKQIKDARIKKEGYLEITKNLNERQLEEAVIAFCTIENEECLLIILNKMASKYPELAIKNAEYVYSELNDLSMFQHFLFEILKTSISVDMNKNKEIIKKMGAPEKLQKDYVSQAWTEILKIEAKTNPKNAMDEALIYWQSLSGEYFDVLEIFDIIVQNHLESAEKIALILPNDWNVQNLAWEMIVTAWTPKNIQKACFLFLNSPVFINAYFRKSFLKNIKERNEQLFHKFIMHLQEFNLPEEVLLQINETCNERSTVHEKIHENLDEKLSAEIQEILYHSTQADFEDLLRKAFTISNIELQNEALLEIISQAKIEQLPHVKKAISKIEENGEIRDHIYALTSLCKIAIQL